MKGKTLNRGLGALVVAAIVSLGIVCGIGSGADHTTEVTATMGAQIWINPPTTVTLTLIPDTTAESVETVHVKTNKNQDWTVVASINKASGILTTTGGTALSSALQLWVGGVNKGPLATTGADTTTIYDDDGTGNPVTFKTGGTARSIGTTFKQSTTYDDGDGSYTGTITFTAAYKPL